MSSLRKKIFTTAVVLAVVFAQVFGLQRGYACDHYGSVVETEAQHCHESAPASQEEHVPCEGECDENQPQAPHVPVVTELTARSSAVAVSAPEFVAVQMFDLFAQLLSEALSAPESLAADRFVLLTESQKPPTAAVVVARSVVLMV